MHAKKQAVIDDAKTLEKLRVGVYEGTTQRRVSTAKKGTCKGVLYLGIIGDDVHEPSLAFSTELDPKSVDEIKILQHQIGHRPIHLTGELSPPKGT